MSRSSDNSAVGDTDRYYSIPQACRELGIPPYKVRRAVKLGLIPSYGVLDRKVYVLLEDIRKALTARGVISDQASFDFTDAVGGSL